jgi:hemoglobin
MRHVPFAIDALARDRWLLHMRAAVAELSQDTPLPLEAAAELDRYLEMAAEAMRNRA